MSRRLARAAPLAALALACAEPAGTPLGAEFLEPWRLRAEAARGLAFDGPVSARVLDPAEVPAALEREIENGPGDEVLARAQWAGRAIGLLPGDTDLRRSLLELGSDGLAGFYSPRLRTLFLVGAPRGVLTRWLGAAHAPRIADESAVVHELVHALQARHTRLVDLVLALHEHDDLSFALGALLEGDAVWSSFRDQELREGVAAPSPEAYAREMSLAWSEESHPGVPRALREPLLLQYPLGYTLAARLAGAGDPAALDAALADPPLSSEELLHPTPEGGHRERPVFLEPPEAAPPDCEPHYRNTLGELGLRIWLAERRGAQSERTRPAEGWEGDRLIVFRCGERAAFAWLVRFDAPAEAREFAVVAEDAVAGLGEGLTGEPRVDAEGVSVLVSAGLDAGRRERFLRETQARSFPHLEAFLDAHPQLRVRADAAL